MSGPRVRFAVANDLDLGTKQLINTSWLHDGRTGYNKYDLAIVENGEAVELWMYNGDTRLSDIGGSGTPRPAPTETTPGDWILVSGEGGSSVQVNGAEVTDPNFITDSTSTATQRGVTFAVDSNGAVTGLVNVSGIGASGIEVLATDPTSPSEGEVWYNTTDDVVRYYDGSTTHTIATAAGLASKMDLPAGWGFFQANNRFTLSPFNSDSGQITTNNAYFNQGYGMNITELSAEGNLAEGINLAVDTDEIATRSDIDDIEDQLTRHGTPSQSYYQFEGVPNTFSDVGTDEAGTTIAFANDFSAVNELVRSAKLEDSSILFSTKVTLRNGSGNTDFKEYLVVGAQGGWFYVADERNVAEYRLEHIEDGYHFYSAASSGATNGGTTGLYESKLWLGNSLGGIVEIPHGSLFDSSGNLAGRTLPRVTGQGDSDYYAVRYLAAGDNSPIYGMDYYYDGSGHAGIIAGNRNGRVFRVRDDNSATISFDAGGIVQEELGDYTVPNSATFTANKFNIRGIKSFTLDGAIEGVGEGYPTMDNESRMWVIFGDAVESRSGGIPVPGIAIANNLHSLTAEQFVATGVARVPGGNDPSEQYVGYSGNSGTFDPELDMTIYDVDYYSDGSNDQYLLIAGSRNGDELGQAERAQMWYCDFDENSPWQPERLPSNNYKAAIGSPIYSLSHGPNADGTTGNAVWMSTGNGAVWSVPNDTSSLSNQNNNTYGSDELLQVLTDPSDATSSPITTGNVVGFDVFFGTGDSIDAIYAAGVNTDGHVVRWDQMPDIELTVTHDGTSYVANYDYDGDEAAMRTHFATASNYTPTIPSSITITTTPPEGETDITQLYITFSVADRRVPQISVSHDGAFRTSNTSFSSGSPWRIFTDEATVALVFFPDGNYTFTTTLATDPDDGTALSVAQQIRDTINASHTTGVTAEVLDMDFNPSITLETPVLLLNQAGVHAFSNRPQITFLHAGNRNVTGSANYNGTNLVLSNITINGQIPTSEYTFVIPSGTEIVTQNLNITTDIDRIVSSATITYPSDEFTTSSSASSGAETFESFGLGDVITVDDFADGAFDTIGAESGLFNPDDYYTKAQTDAKIDAIETIMDTGTIVSANPGGGEQIAGATDLTSIAIDSVNYNIPVGGSGETTVSHNAALQTLTIDNHDGSANEIVYLNESPVWPSSGNPSFILPPNSVWEYQDDLWFYNGTEQTIDTSSYSIFTPEIGTADAWHNLSTSDHATSAVFGSNGYFLASLTAKTYSAGTNVFFHSLGSTGTAISYDTDVNQFSATIPGIAQGDTDQHVIKVNQSTGIGTYGITLSSGQGTALPTGGRIWDAVELYWQPATANAPAFPDFGINSELVILTDIESVDVLADVPFPFNQAPTTQGGATTPEDGNVLVYQGADEPLEWRAPGHTRIGVEVGGQIDSVIAENQYNTVILTNGQFSFQGTSSEDLTTFDTSAENTYSIVFTINEIEYTITTPGDFIDITDPINAIFQIDTKEDEVTIAPAVSQSDVLFGFNVKAVVSIIGDIGAVEHIGGRIEFSGNGVRQVTGGFEFTTSADPNAVNFDTSSTTAATNWFYYDGNDSTWKVASNSELWGTISGDDRSKAANLAANLLTGGFLLPQDTTHTGSREKYDDTDRRFSSSAGSTPSYYYDETEEAWFTADTGGTRIVGF